MDTKTQLSRRQLLILASSSIVAAPLSGLANDAGTNIHVVKNPQCGCCNAWIEILEGDGFNVTTEDRSNSELAAFKSESGIPKDMRSCHTARIFCLRTIRDLRSHWWFPLEESPQRGVAGLSSLRPHRRHCTCRSTLVEGLRCSVWLDPVSCLLWRGSRGRW